MRERINSVASSTAKTLRSIIGEAVILQQEPPSKAELVWGISTRSISIPLAGTTFICLVIDWHYPVAIGKDWSNTFLAIAIIASFFLSIFLFINMLLRLKKSPRAATLRRYLAYLDLVIIVLLVAGAVARSSGDDWTDSESLYDDPTPSAAHMLVFMFALMLAFTHLVGGTVMATAAAKNWIQIHKLSPEEYRDYQLGIRPLYPPPAYGARG